MLFLETADSTMQAKIEPRTTGKHILSDFKALPEQDDVLITAAHVPEYIGLMAQNLAGWRREGAEPGWVALGHRIFYRSSNLGTWIKSRRRQNTIEAT